MSFVHPALSCYNRKRIQRNQSSGGLGGDSMKGSYVNKFFFGIFLLCVFLSSVTLNGCARLKGKDAAMKDPAEPLLISTDADYMFWCGADALIYAYTERDITRYVETEIYWYDVHTGRRVIVGKESDDDNAKATEGQQTEEEGKETGDYFVFPMACTPDGKWLVYLNKGSLRWDESGVRGIGDIWRYEVATGRHEKIAIARDISGFDKGILSPDGKTLFLGKKPMEGVEMPEPRWEIVWSELEDLSSALWFQNSSAVITSYWGRRDRNNDMVIEVVSPRRKTVVFNPEDLNSFSLLYSDKEGRIYVYFWDSEGKRHVARCDVDLEDESVSCEDVFIEGGRKVNDLEVFSDGEFIAFTEDGGRCVKALRAGEERARCITPPIDTLGDYRVTPGRSIKISPDDRWLAFTLLRMDKAGEGIGEDLYIIELNKD